MDITGHSLGATLTQWFAAAWTALAPGTGVVVDNVVSFNGTGITNAPNAVTGPLMTYASSFNPARANHVTHYVVNGDLVSMAGQAFIPGRVEMATYSVGINLLNHHVLPLLTPRIAPNDRPADLTWRSYPDVSTLNQATFSFDDKDYKHDLELLQVAIDVAAAEIPALIPLEVVPALMVYRGTTDASRALIGALLRTVADSATIVFARDVSATVTSLIEGAKEIYKHTELDLGDDVNVVVSAGAGGQPQVRFQGGLGLTLKQTGTINLPPWLGGPIAGDSLFRLADLDTPAA